MKQKHFIDIENLREEDTELRQGNGHGFEVGDIISITEKIDGANACVTYDPDKDCLAAFSRKQELDIGKNLSGFWNYVQTLDIKPFKDNPSYRVFGEWGVKNKIKYNDSFRQKWIIFDIYDMEKEAWLPQDLVKGFCLTYGLEYIHELYYGKFISWAHCRLFLTRPGYGDEQEGIVVKNMTKLADAESRMPAYLKIVNDSFRESMKTKEKKIDPEAEKVKAEAIRITESIVTRNRVEKELHKMRDEGIVPEKMQPSDMKVVAQNLPKRIFQDCLKEEKELVLAAGAYFGKTCGQIAMKHARDIILGG